MKVILFRHKNTLKSNDVTPETLPCLQQSPIPSTHTRCAQMRENAELSSWHSTKAYMPRTQSRVDKADGCISRVWVIR